MFSFWMTCTIAVGSANDCHGPYQVLGFVGSPRLESGALPSGMYILLSPS
jgi:hypothetical protein